MTGTTLTTVVSHGITLGSNGIASPLLITATGGVYPGGTTGATAIVDALAGSLISNYGTIGGGVGTKGVTSAGGAGGAGVAVSNSGSLTNGGLIAGGQGGIASGAGGVGVVLSGGSGLTNTGTITGGKGAASKSAVTTYGGAGGAGVSLDAATLTNSGTISGGAPGFPAGYGHRMGGPVQGGAAILADNNSVVTNSGTLVGGDFSAAVVLTGTSSLSSTGLILGGRAATAVLISGSSLANYGTITAGQHQINGTEVTVSLTSGTLTNQGTLLGGVGVVKGFQGYTYGWQGGAALSVQAGTVTNSGTVTGGAGAYAQRQGGDGGAGVLLAGGSLTNTGRIAGGAAGGEQATYAQAGTGGTGVKISGGSLTNAGMIVGGAGGANPTTQTNYGYGGAGVTLQGGLVTNTGTIAGGAAGNPGAPAGSAGVLVTGGTLVNGGTIIAGGGVVGMPGDAVQFHTTAGGANTATLVVDPRAVFVGAVVAETGFAATLELGGSTAATLAGFGTQFTGFSTLTIDSGAVWTVDATVSALSALSAITAGAADTVALSGGGALALGGYGFGTVELGDGSYSYAGTQSVPVLRVDAGASLTGSGTLGQSLVLGGTLVEASGSRIAGTLTGSGTLAAQGGGVVTVATAVDRFSGTFGDGGVGDGTILLTSALTLTAGSAASIAANAVVDVSAAAKKQVVSVTGGVGAALTNHGTLEALGLGKIAFSAGLVNDGVVRIETGASSAFGGAVTNNGTVVLERGVLSFAKALTGTGEVEIGGGTLALARGVSAGETVTFTDPAGVLKLAPASVAKGAFKATIADFAVGDRIMLSGATETSYGFSNNTLTILNGAVKVAALAFAPGYSAGDFVVQNQAGVGVVVTHG